MKPLHYAQQIAYSSKDVLMFTYEMALKYKDVPGSYCEFGVAAGAQIIAMAYAAPDKMIYAFDSFQGIPIASNRDDQMPGIAKLSKTEQLMLPDPDKQILETSGATAVSKKDFIAHLTNAGINRTNIRIFEGWFQDTVDQIDTDLNILRLDGDLYQSTWVCLLHQFRNLVPGGVCIIDDWSLQGCQAACKEYFAFIDYTPDYKFLDGTAYFFK